MTNIDCKVLKVTIDITCHPFNVSGQQPRYDFADFTLSTGRRTLLRAGVEVPLIPRYFDLLVLLVERRNEAGHRREILETNSWREYLEKYAGMGEEVLKFIQKSPEAAWAIGADAYPAWLAWRNGDPGFAGMDIGYDTTPYDSSAFYFPDGNASVARLLVRKLVPSVAPGSTMDDIVTAKFEFLQVLIRDITGHVFARETRGIELRDRRVAVPDRANQPVQILVDEPVGADKPLNFLDTSSVCDQLGRGHQGRSHLPALARR